MYYSLLVVNLKFFPISNAAEFSFQKQIMRDVKIIQSVFFSSALLYVLMNFIYLSYEMQLGFYCL